MLTCNALHDPLRLAAGDEDDISLAGVCIIVLQEEELIDAVVSERRSGHYRADRAG